jgi:signal transduction histidine kinase
MVSIVRGEKWLNWAAFATWLVVGVPTFAGIFDGELSGVRAIAWSAMFAVFGATLAVFLGPRSISRTSRIALLVIQSLAALGMIYAGRNVTAGATLVIVAAEAAGTLSARGAWLWVAGQTLGLAVIVGRLTDWSDAIALGGAFAGFQAFAIAAMSLAISERSARQDLSRANAELHATRALLDESSRVDERLRISRDLHDTLGHHLTALSLQLEVASRLTSAQAEGHVREAHAITKLLLGDVRDVVSRMRETSRIDLGQAIRMLADAGGALRIHVDLPETLLLDETDRAHALLRCVQEIITNATRHGGARNLWIRIERRPDGIELHARDDGRGARDMKWGNGLTGMRERFDEFSGRLDVTPGEGRGFEVHGFMPRPGTVS